MSKNICRLDGNQIFLSVLRDDEEAVGLYAKWMSDETTCVFIEHAHSVVDITRMPGWVRDHSVMRMGIVLKETDTLIGYCHIDHRTEDMSAWLSINIGEKSVRGKGIGTEVVQILQGTPAAGCLCKPSLLRIPFRMLQSLLAAGQRSISL